MTRVTAESSPSGTFYRASRWDADGSTLTLGPSAPSFEAAVTEIDRDAGGPSTFPVRRRLGALAVIALLTSGCAGLSPADALDESGQRIEQARQSVEALAVVVATARAACDAQSPRPEQCRLLDDVPIDKARAALLDAAAAHQIATDVLNALGPYAEAAHDVIEGAP